MKGYRKLVALWTCILAAMIGATYMTEMVFISFASLLGAGLGIFAYANVSVHKNTDYENFNEPNPDLDDRAG